jgi:polar amino acid transport system permease protein
MIHDFGVVWAERGLMLSGLANTVILSVLSAVCALVLGALLAMLLLRQDKVSVVAASVFVDVMRCTPFLLFAYIIY